MNFIVVGITQKQEVITRSEVSIQAPRPIQSRPAEINIPRVAPEDDVQANMCRLQEISEKSRQMMLDSLAEKKVDLDDVLEPQAPVKRKGGRPRKNA